MRYTARLLFIFSSLLSVSHGVLADEGTGDQQNRADVKVVVTASRGQAQDTLDVPQSIDSVSGQDIEKQVYTDIEDVIEKLPGISLAPAEGNPNFWQQGFSVRGLGGQRVLTFSDGIRQASHGIGYGGGNLSLYDLSSVESIEVLKGPASVLYGTDSFGGVVNIVTKSPTKRSEFGLDGSMRYSFDGSRDMQRTSGYIDVGDEGYALILGTSYTDASEPNLPNDIDPEGGSFREIGVWGKLDFFLTDNSKLRFIANQDRNEDVEVLNTTMALPIAVLPPGSASPVVGPLSFRFPLYERQMFGAEYVYEDDDETLEFFKTGLYWQEIDRKFERLTSFYTMGQPGFAGPPLFIDLNAGVASSGINSDDSEKTLEWQTQARVDMGCFHKLTFGFDYGHDDTYMPEVETQTILGMAGIGTIRNGSVTTSNRIRGDAEQDRFGLYAQDTWNLDPVEVTPGVRVDYFNVDNNLNTFSDSQSGVSGSLGAVYRNSQQRSYYMSMASGFRMPDLGERYVDGVVNFGAPSRIIGKEDLDPERSWVAEVGTKYKTRTFEYEFATYYHSIDNFIGLNRLGTVGGFLTDQYNNLGNVKLYGGEFGINWRVNNRFNLYTTVDRTWTDSTSYVDVRNWEFNYGAGYTLPMNTNLIEAIKGDVVVRTILESEDYTETFGRDPYNGGGFTVIDVALNFYTKKIGKNKFQITTGIKNLLNREYQEPFFTIYQPERSFFGAIQFNF